MSVNIITSIRSIVSIVTVTLKSWLIQTLWVTIVICIIWSWWNINKQQMQSIGCRTLSLLMTSSTTNNTQMYRCNESESLLRLCRSWRDKSFYLPTQTETNTAISVDEIIRYIWQQARHEKNLMHLNTAQTSSTWQLVFTRQTCCQCVI